MLYIYISHQCFNPWENISLNDLKNHVYFHKIEDQLQIQLYKNVLMISKVILNKIFFSYLPNVFWKRKQHVIDFPYEDIFLEKQIPTKSLPIK